MTIQEQYREEVIKAIIQGSVSVSEAAQKLNLSIRQVKRVKARYIKQGSCGLIHASRGVVGNRRTPHIVEKEIVNLARDTYKDFGPQLLSEKLCANHAIDLDPDTIRRVLVDHGIWKTRPQRKSTYRSWRERKACYGELQQFDGSYHLWLEDRYCDENCVPQELCLLASIDDATGRITHAVFDHNEGVEAVFRFWREYLTRHGIPQVLYLDKFSTYKINHPAAVDNHELMTQFQRAAKELDIRIITAHSPQAKGRVERLFQTLQDRLVKEMRLQGISTLSGANQFLKDIFIPWFNDRFGRVPASAVDVHRPLAHMLREDLAHIFSSHHTRRVNNDFTIQFHNVWHQLQEIQPTTIFKNDRVVVEQHLDGTLCIRKGNYTLSYSILPERPRPQKSNPLILTTHINNWIPPQNHPWRQYAR